MSELPTCPKCAADYTYQDGALLVCPSCGHEWSAAKPGATAAGGTGGDGVSAGGVDEGDEPVVVRDAVGNVLATGDSVTVIKDLKVKGSSLVVKGGTKVKNIRLVDGAGGHNIDCKIDGIGAMQLKSEFVRKA